MSNFNRAQEENLPPIDPFIDPVSYLAGLGIEAELVRIEADSLEEAA